MRCELVVFDCDGTLVDSESIHRRELAATLTDLGVPTSAEDAEARYAGADFPAIAADVDARLGRPAPAGWLEGFQERRAAAFAREGVPQVAGAREAVLAVREAGVAWCVASQGALSKTETTLGLSGLGDLFPPERRFSATQVAEGKPAPDLFLHAAAACGTDPAGCVVIEDSVLGVQAAVAAGMRALGLVRDAGADELEAAGAQPVGSLAEAVEIALRSRG